MIIEFNVKQDGFIQNMAALVKEINNDKNTVKLLRLLGNTAQVVLPMCVEGYTIEVIGKYCFSENAHLSKECEGIIIDYLNNHRGMREISGEYIEEIGLPESVTEVEGYAFYNCRNMKKLTVGKDLLIFGNDVFMNCKRLKRVEVKAGIDEQTGVPFFLKQLNKGIEIAFISDNNIEGLFYYPEYSEIYEEIGPAHIFEMNIQGEGYRARQMFKDRVVDIAGYDKIFEAAKALEEVTTLAYMAIDRLRYCCGMTRLVEEIYREYIKDNCQVILRKLVKEEDLESIRFLCEEKLVTDEGLLDALKYTTQIGWAVGSAEIIRLKNDTMSSKEDRYAF